jgi:hypothetical protein
MLNIKSIFAENYLSKYKDLAGVMIDSFKTRYTYVNIKADDVNTRTPIITVLKNRNNVDKELNELLLKSGGSIYSKYYISNFGNKVRLIVEEAIKLSGKMIHIDDTPMPVQNIGFDPTDAYINGGRYSNYNRNEFLDTHFSIYVEHTNETLLNLGNFWKIYHELSKSPEWKLQLELTAWGELDNVEIE